VVSRLLDSPFQDQGSASGKRSGVADFGAENQESISASIESGSKVLLGTSEPQFLAEEARPFRGAGVEFHVDVPWGEIEAIHLAHQAVDPSASALEDRPWGERAFHVTLAVTGP
jgi:hypothetical protein